MRWNLLSTPVLSYPWRFPIGCLRSLNVRVFQTMTDFEPLISSFLDLYHALTIAHWSAMCLQSSIFPLAWSSTLPITSPSVRPNLVVLPTSFFFSKCGGLPTGFNLDYLHTWNWAPLSTIMQIFATPNQRIFNQQFLRHCLL